MEVKLMQRRLKRNLARQAAKGILPLRVIGRSPNFHLAVERPKSLIVVSGSYLRQRDAVADGVERFGVEARKSLAMLPSVV